MYIHIDQSDIQVCNNEDFIQPHCDFSITNYTCTQLIEAR